MYGLCLLLIDTVPRKYRDMKSFYFTDIIIWYFRLKYQMQLNLIVILNIVV
jgi:hypothetical protein